VIGDVLMLAIAVVMLTWFAKKGWLRSMETPLPRRRPASVERQ
jgi:hypothetical protein